MTSRVAGLVAICAVGLAVPAAAQRRGTIEIDALARYTNFDNEVRLDNTGGVGGRLSVYAWSGLAVEVDVSRGDEYTPLHVRLVHHAPVGERMEVLAGGGFVRNWYGDPWGANDDGLSTILGVRYQLTSRLWLRLGTDADVMFHTSDQSPFAFYSGNWGLHFGASTRLNAGGAQ